MVQQHPDEIVELIDRLKDALQWLPSPVTVSEPNTIEPRIRFHPHRAQRASTGHH